MSFDRLIAAAIFAIAAALPAKAQLPALTEAPWIGFFAVHHDSRQTFSIDSEGEMLLQPVASGTPISDKYGLHITPKILETAPDGKTISKRVIPESLTSPDSSTEKLEKTTYSGKTTGDASFEITVEQQRGTIFVTGRILDPGKIKNPLQMAISARIKELHFQRKESTDALGEREKKREEKAFLDKLKGDRVILKWTDGKSRRMETTDGAGLKPQEFNGPGISSVEVESKVYRNRKLTIHASPNTRMTVVKPEDSPFFKGFELQWPVDPATDPERKARLAFQFR